jgi:hypothetical protein
MLSPSHIVPSGNTTSSPKTLPLRVPYRRVEEFRLDTAVSCGCRAQKVGGESGRAGKTHRERLHNARAVPVKEDEARSLIM